MATTENPSIPAVIPETNKVRWRHRHPKLNEAIVCISGVLIGSFVGLSFFWMVTNFTHFSPFDTFLLMILTATTGFFGAMLGGIGAILAMIYQHLKDSE
jgi:hypothetical protein